MPDSSIIGSLFGPGTPNYAAIAKRSAARRKGLIDLGMQQINAVYGGGSAPFYSLAKYPGSGQFNKHNQYYSINNSGAFVPYWGGGAKPAAGYKPSSLESLGPLGTAPFTSASDLGHAALSSKIPALKWVGPLGPLGGLLSNLFGGKKLSPAEVAEKAFKHNQLFTKGETQTFEGFQEPFFQQRARDYVNFALPQVADQYQANRKAVAFNLANRGLQDSSVAEQATADLEKTAGTARQSVADTGINLSNELKQNVEASRQQDIEQLYQSADPAHALQSAIASAAGFRFPTKFEPLGDLFSNLARTYYLNQVLNNSRTTGAYGGGVPYDLSGAVSGPITR